MQPSRCAFGLIAFVLATLCTRACVAAPTVAADKSVFMTPLTKVDLDPSAFTVWLDGKTESASKPGVWERSVSRASRVTFQDARLPPRASG